MSIVDNDDEMESHYFNADYSEARVTIESFDGNQLTEILITKSGLLIDYQDSDGLEFISIPFSNLRSIINIAKGES